jgi:hypothetical protein
MNPDPEACARILDHLRAAYERNPQAETPGLELERELGLTRWTVRDCLEYLAHEGFVEGDLFPVNVWVRWAGGEESPGRGAGNDSE